MLLSPALGLQGSLPSKVRFTSYKTRAQKHTYANTYSANYKQCFLFNRQIEVRENKNQTWMFEEGGLVTKVQKSGVTRKHQATTPSQCAFCRQI